MTPEMKKKRDELADKYFKREKHPLDREDPVCCWYKGFDAAVELLEKQKYPGNRNCVTHHFACDCREAMFKDRETKLVEALKLCMSRAGHQIAGQGCRLVIQTAKETLKDFGYEGTSE